MKYVYYIKKDSKKDSKYKKKLSKKKVEKTNNTYLKLKESL